VQPAALVLEFQSPLRELSRLFKGLAFASSS
jgi:hypothetical protein